MDHHETLQRAIDAKARADRLYMHYALALAGFLTVAGLALVVLGIGDHLDIVIAGRGDLEARFVNASPGVALWLIGAFIFWWSRPRKVVGHLKTEKASQSDTDRSSQEAGEAPRPILVSHIGISPRTGKMIDAFKGRYGAYIVDHHDYCELPDYVVLEKLSVGAATDLLDHMRRARVEFQRELMKESPATILIDFGTNPFSESSIVVFKAGNRHLLGDGVRQYALPSNVDPMKLTRYEAIHLLLSEKATTVNRSLVGSQQTAAPPPPPTAPATRKPVVTERTEMGFELYQSAPRRRDDDSEEA